MTQNNAYGTGAYGYQTPYNPYMAPGQGQGYITPQVQQPQVQQQLPQLAQQLPQAAQQLPQVAQQGQPHLIVPPMPSSMQIPIKEQSYIENILRMNIGKLATVYMTFENNKEWNAKIFKGIIEAAGRDHLILSDPQTGMRYLLPLINLDYITFDEEIEYSYPLHPR